MLFLVFLLLLLWFLGVITKATLGGVLAHSADRRDRPRPGELHRPAGVRRGCLRAAASASPRPC